MLLRQGRPFIATCIFALGVLDLAPLSSAWAWKVSGTFPLSDVSKASGAGLAFRGLSDEDLQTLKRQAKDFVSYRKDKLAAAGSADFLSACISQSKTNPFCEVFTHIGEDIEAANGSSNGTSNGTLPDDTPDDDVVLPGLGVAALPQLISEGNVAALKTFRRKEVYRAIRKIADTDGWEKLEALKTQALNPLAPCPAASVLVALGTAAEDEFPDLDFRRLAVSTYARTHQCAPEYSRVEGMEPDVAQARFRLSLLHLWNQDCSAATPILSLLSAERDGNYVSRSLYWRARCAEARGDKLQVEVLRTALIKNNPLGYHTLLANRDRLDLLANQVHMSTPSVRLTSDRRPDLNSLVFAVELLLAQKEEKAAREILAGMKEDLPNAEPEFQLYVAVLASRAEAHIYPFQVLGRVFKENPKLLTTESLEIFYPLKYFPALSGSSQGFDPYFLAALIRQESGFNPGARSRVGALGLMQLMPRTARLTAGVGRGALLSPGTNVKVGVRYLSQLMAKWRNDVELVLASYNAGPNKVDEWLRRYPVAERSLFLDLIPISETRDYVALISRNYFWYSHLYTTRAFRFDTDRAPAHAGGRSLPFRAFEARPPVSALPGTTGWVSLISNEDAL